MSIRALPLLVFAFVLYNVIALSLGEEALGRQIFELRLLSGGIWKFTWGDLVLLVTLLLLFVEIVKSTFTTTSTLIDHALSMIVFMAVGAEFLIVPPLMPTRPPAFCAPATSTFVTPPRATSISRSAGARSISVPD